MCNNHKKCVVKPQSICGKTLIPEKLTEVKGKIQVEVF
jgi:hypothetical protein